MKFKFTNPFFCIHLCFMCTYLDYFQIFRKNMNYLLKTFGCQMNYADSEKINMILLQSGFRKVLECGDAGVLILNTCSVRQK